MSEATVDPKYTEGFAEFPHIQEQLSQTQDEMDHFGKYFVGILDHFSADDLRNHVGLVPSHAQRLGLWLKAQKTDLVDHQNYSSVTGGKRNNPELNAADSGEEAGLNYEVLYFDGQRFKQQLPVSAFTTDEQNPDYPWLKDYLKLDANGTERLEPYDIYKLFPPGQQDQWPILVPFANSSISAPQAFYDTAEGAVKLVAKLEEEAGRPAKHIIPIGFYYSEKNLNANAVGAHRRFNEKEDDAIKHVMQASWDQVMFLTCLLSQHHPDGTLKGEWGKDADGQTQFKPELRRDAHDILGHIVSCGYSAGYMINNDAFRLLRQGLIESDFKIPNGAMSVNPLRFSADNLIGKVRSIGIGGMDRKFFREFGMPQRANLVSVDDKAVGLLGRNYLSGPESVDVSKPLPTQQKGQAGHSQTDYFKKILSDDYRDQFSQMQDKLSGNRGLSL